MAAFSVLVLTAAPAGLAAEAGGAFVKIDGREALLRGVELFLNRDNVKQIQIAFLPDDLEEAKRKFGGHFGFSGVKVIAGGPRWADQLKAAGPLIDPACSHVLVHDAARPAVPYSDIDAVMAAAESASASAVGLVAACRTPLVEVDEGGNPLAFHPTGHYMHWLTPTVYARETFLEVARTGQVPHASAYTLIKGSPLNVRVGGSGEASLVKTMLNLLPKPKLKAPSSPFDEAQW